MVHLKSSVNAFSMKENNNQTILYDDKEISSDEFDKHIIERQYLYNTLERPVLYRQIGQDKWINGVSNYIHITNNIKKHTKQQKIITIAYVAILSYGLYILKPPGIVLFLFFLTPILVFTLYDKWIKIHFWTKIPIVPFLHDSAIDTDDNDIYNKVFKYPYSDITNEPAIIIYNQYASGYCYILSKKNGHYIKIILKDGNYESPIVKSFHLNEI